MATKKSLLVVCAGIFVAAAIALVAQPAYALFHLLQSDHLKCYEIEEADAPIEEAQVGLLNQFGFENCKLVLPAKLFCAQTIKFRVDGQDTGILGAVQTGDFLCYEISCDDDQKRRITVLDQFNPLGAEIEIEEAEILCVPAIKFLTKGDDDDDDDDGPPTGIPRL